MDLDIVPLQPRYQHGFLRPRYNLIFLGLATVIGGLIPAVWRSVKHHKHL